MKENKYDDPAFFAQYSHMPRSVEGLAGAGEWHELRKLFPELGGKKVLDLGCGFGWHCRYAVERGASSVVGVDISEKMLEEARRRTDSPRIDYVRAAIEDFTYPSAAFDVVVSSLALHYVANYVGICQEIERCLVSGGAFVFSVEHPIFTAQGPQEWCRDENGIPQHWPVDDYFREDVREATFLGEPIRKYHRTLTTYLGGLMRIGFIIADVVEPQPDTALIDAVPGMRDELRRPMMLLVAARKP